MKLSSRVPLWVLGGLRLLQELSDGSTLYHMPCTFHDAASDLILRHLIESAMLSCESSLMPCPSLTTVASCIGSNLLGGQKV